MPLVVSLEQRAQWTAEFFQRAFARPEFVGWHYCGLIDASMKVIRKQNRQHSGLIDGYGEPYPVLKELLQRCSNDMYKIASGRI